MITSKIRRGRGESVLRGRLEAVAGVLQQARQLLQEVPEVPIDEEALLARAVQRACGGCPLRRTCRDRASLPGALGTGIGEPAGNLCRKHSRLSLELGRSREQLRLLQAQSAQRREYRRAVEQQYQFLGEYVMALPAPARRKKRPLPVEAEVRSHSREGENGDICQQFRGPEGDWFLLLCDGMGTGPGAAEEGRVAAGMLRRLLSAGFPPEHALASVNSLCCLRGQAGAVTVDLLQLRPDSGRAAIYKWGAAPSYLLRQGRVEQLGTAGPPPGLGLDRARETVERLSLARGDVVVLVSDGVDGEDVRSRLALLSGRPLGELAAGLLEAPRTPGDDATVAAVRLHPST